MTVADLLDGITVTDINYEGDDDLAAFVDFSQCKSYRLSDTLPAD